MEAAVGEPWQQGKGGCSEFFLEVFGLERKSQFNRHHLADPFPEEGVDEDGTEKCLHVVSPAEEDILEVAPPELPGLPEFPKHDSLLPQEGCNEHVPRFQFWLQSPYCQAYGAFLNAQVFIEVKR